jgi:hypothetical protein
MSFKNLAEKPSVLCSVEPISLNELDFFYRPLVVVK